MITVGGKFSLYDQKVDLEKRFPDGTFAFHVPQSFPISSGALITWYYEGEHELAALLYITNHLRQKVGVKDIFLSLPYVPNSRMDRTCHDDEVFTLKIFADFINFLNFDSVSVLDPHSNVTPALLNRCKVWTPERYIQNAIEDIGDPDLLLFYPDEGAAKRYSGMIAMPYGFGIKRRRWETGQITGLDVFTPVDPHSRSFLIVDDICCRGDTFLHSAKGLKEQGAKKVFVFCSHCEPTIFKSELLTTDFVDHVYTTDSIFRGSHEKITVFPLNARKEDSRDSQPSFS